MDIVFYIAVSIFTLIGVMTAIKSAVYHLFTMGDNDKIVEVIYLSGDNAEFVLRSAITHFQWRFDREKHKILALNVGLDEANFKICKKICDEYAVPMCNKENIEEYLGD